MAFAHECYSTVWVSAVWCAGKAGPTRASVQGVLRMQSVLNLLSLCFWRTCRYTREPTNRSAVVHSDSNDVLVCDPQSGACCHGGVDLRCSLCLKFSKSRGKCEKNCEGLSKCVLQKETETGTHVASYTRSLVHPLPQYTG